MVSDGRLAKDALRQRLAAAKVRESSAAEIMASLEKSVESARRNLLSSREEVRVVEALLKEAEDRWVDVEIYDEILAPDDSSKRRRVSAPSSGAGVAADHSTRGIIGGAAGGSNRGQPHPPEPVPPKTFSKMNGLERKEYLSDKQNLANFFGKVMTSLEGAKCALCELPADPKIDKRCDKCGIFSHADCADPARGEGSTCFLCRFIEDNSNDSQYEVPKCHMCCHPNNGPLVRTLAKPLSMKKWKLNMNAFQRSNFGNNKFCHALCGM